MCGIAAILGSHPENKNLLQKMTSAVSHRGPDGEGFFFANQIALGHRRLSIIDLSHGADQPMAYGEYWIIFNGEIFNYIELRQELLNEGYPFTTQSDTEVILACYKKWGLKALDKLNGMFSFVIYDAGKNKVLAVRDRFGVKPLYHWSSQGRIYIASEIKQFTVIPEWKSILNDQMASDFLNYSLTDHTDQTLFKDVKQLRPGHYFEIDLNESEKNISPKQWYDLRKHINPQNLGPDEFLKILKDSISLRLRADVSIGSCLSGGLDSSSLVCLINEKLKSENSHEKQKTFSACSEIARFDEKIFVDQVVQKTNVEAHYVYPKQDYLFEILEKLTWHQDEPFGTTSIFAQWCVFQLAQQNKVKVMLDGQGADEQLAGYHKFFPIFWVSLFKNLNWIQLFHELKAARAKHGYSFLKAFKMMLGIVAPDWLVPHLKALLTQNSQRFFNFPSSVSLKNPLRDLGASTSIQNNSLAQMTQTNLQMLLHWEDRNSMAHGVEARVPFLDYRLVEFNLSLPDQQKIKNGTTKAILREALSGILPDTIKNRMDKLGFVTPESVWVTEQSPLLFRAALEEAVQNSNGLISPKILDYFEKAIKNEIPYDFVFWRAISFGVWIKVFGVKRDT